MQKIRLLVPNLPTPEQIGPFLSAMHDRRRYTNFGPLVAEFESSVRELLPCSNGGNARAVAVGSGTLALDLALRLLELPKNARILLPSFNFPAAAHVVCNAGLIPVFCEVDAEQWVLTPEIAHACIARAGIDAVVPVATFGRPLDVDAWDALVASTGIPVVIDAAAALGQQTVGRHVTVAFSLHATKPFGIGEGGLLASADESLIERARRASNFGFSSRQTIGLGLNAKMSEIHAAVGLAQWERWPGVEKTRREIWQVYGDHLEQIAGIALPADFRARPLAVLQVRLPVPADWVARPLADTGIETRQWYCPPLHQHATFAHFGRIGDDGSDRLTLTDELTISSLGLPWHSFLSPEDITRVCESLRNTLSDIGQRCKCASYVQKRSWERWIPVD